MAAGCLCCFLNMYCLQYWIPVKTAQAACCWAVEKSKHVLSCRISAAVHLCHAGISQLQQHTKDHIAWQRIWGKAIFVQAIPLAKQSSLLAEVAYSSGQCPPLLRLTSNSLKVAFRIFGVLFNLDIGPKSFAHCFVLAWQSS